jgi:hypothetical protein
MPAEAFNSWGWRIPFLLSVVVIVAATSSAARSTRRRPSPRKASAATSALAVFDAIRYSWQDMLRVICMALMNVIPVVTTIFGAAYAVQKATASSSRRTSTCGSR